MLLAMSQSPMIKLPAMTTWSVWGADPGPGPGQEGLALAGPEDGVGLHGQVGRRGQDAVQEQCQEAFPAGQLGFHYGGRARADQDPWLQRGGQAQGEPRGHAVHVRLPFRGLLRRLGPSSGPMRRTAITTRTAPSAIFTASAASEGTVLGLGGLLPVATTVTVTTMARDTSHPNTKAAPFRLPCSEGSTTRNAVSGSGSSVTPCRSGSG